MIDIGPTKAVLVYETDFNHSRKSRNLIGVYRSKSKLQINLRKYIKKELEDNFDDEDVNISDKIREIYMFLLDQKQTQHLYSCELLIEEITINEEL